MGKAIEGSLAYPAPHSRNGRPKGAATALLGNHILDVALELFFTHGYAGTSMDAIAASAQVTKRTLYQRYGNKQGLLRAARQRQGEEFLEISQLSLSGGTLREQLTRAALAMLDVTLTPRSLGLERLREEAMKIAPDPADDTHKQVTEGWTQQIKNILTSAPEFTAHEGSDPAFLASLLYDVLVTTPRMRILRLQSLENTPPAKTAFIKQALDALAAGLPSLRASYVTARPDHEAPSAPTTIQE